MSQGRSKEKEPLFHVVKRANISWWESLLIRLAALLLGLFLGMLILTIAYHVNPFAGIGQLFVGTFGTKRRFLNFLRSTVLLLGVGLALIPAFKMKFWNLGGNGQILMGVLVTVMLMHGLGGVWPDWAIVLLSIPCAILAGALWAFIPALFKAFFNTNESLFTLMMNYLATGLVTLYLSAAVTNGSGSMNIQEHGHLPTIGGSSTYFPLIIILVVLAFMIYYLNFSRHGYELSVVGESNNTARYVGMNVKKVVLRTLVLSGAICGLVGLLIGGAIDYTVSEGSALNMGFIAIMAVWLAKSNPLILVLTSAFICFVTRGMSQVQTTFSITNGATSDIVIGLIYFFIIGCEFFIEYKVMWRKKASAPHGDPTPMDTISVGKEGK